MNTPASNQPLVLRVGANIVGRDFAVGDIHGCFSKLQVALDQIGFSPDTDRLFSVGDLVDRGPESHHVLNWLDQPWFYAVCGNHELLTWRRAIGQPIQEVNHLDHGGEWLDACDADQRLRIAQHLRALPLGIEVETPHGTVGVIHADFPYDDWLALHRPGFDADDIRVCLWSRQRYQAQHQHPIRNIRAVVHGHSTLPQPVQLGNAYFIDTGGWLDHGRFTLMNLHTLQVQD